MPYFSGPNGIREVADPGERVMQSFNDSRRKRLLSDYFTNGQTDLGQLARIDPEAAQQIQAQQKDQQVGGYLAKLLTAPEDQRQSILAQVMGLDKRAGMEAVKTFDPRYAGAGMPSELQTFQAMTKGMPDDDVMTARRVHLGLDPRKSSAAIGYQKVIGPDGREMLVATDPRAIGAQTIGGGPSFGSFAGQQQAPSRNDMEADIALANQMAQAGMDPDKIDAFLAARGQRANAATQGPNQFASQTPQEKSYATEIGQQRAQLDALPERGGLEAQIAAMKAKAEADARAAAEREATVATKAADAQRALGLLDEAERLVPLSTGSAAGNVVDSLAGAFGHATPGAQAIAGLQTIAGQLTSSMPRMQGPQSDKDVQLYKQMAGDLANPNLPVQTRMAALKQIRRLNQKYAGQQQDQRRSNAVPAGGGWGIREIK